MAGYVWIDLNWTWTFLVKVNQVPQIWHGLP
jgi:hypothetical protein